MEPKFIILHTRAEDGTDIYEFANIEDGLVVGAVAGRVMYLGEAGSEDQKRRGYVDKDYALTAMKKHCRGLAGREDVDFEIREAPRSDILLPRTGMPPTRRTH